MNVIISYRERFEERHLAINGIGSASLRCARNDMGQEEGVLGYGENEETSPVGRL